MKNERKEELKDEMKNRISLALKDPILQQGFEIICKENAELERKLEQTEKDLADYQFNYPTIKELEKENAELKEQLNKNPCVCNTEWHCNDCLEQLTNAKELLKRCYDKYGIYDIQLLKELEQFLNSEVENV